MTETITTNENQPKEEKIKRLIQNKIDELEKQWWDADGNNVYQEQVQYAQWRLKELLEEIETL